MEVKAKYIVVYGDYDKKAKGNEFEFISVLGAYDTTTTAYGASLLYLNDLIADARRDKDTITPLFPLEGETGFGMEIIRNGDKNSTIDYAYILFVEEETE